MPAKNRGSMKNNADAIIHTVVYFQMKTNNLMADEKSPARISHRHFVAKLLRIEGV